MQQKTALRARSHGKVVRADQDSGVIAKTLKPAQSAGTKSALDNRSHRTPELTCKGII